jgi:type IV fimbrial biogenesis protein FimT
MKKQIGVTLTELLITVSVIGIMAALAAPAFTDFIRNERIVAEANEMVAAFYLARTEAIKRNSRVTVCKSSNPDAADPTCNTSATPGWETGWIIFADGTPAGGANGTRQSAELLIKAQGALNGLVLRPRDSGTDPNIQLYVSYTPRGTARIVGGGANQTGVFRLCDDRGIDDARAIELSATGRVQVLGPDTGAAARIGSCP